MTRALRMNRSCIVTILALLLAVAGCDASDDDSSPDAEYGTSLTIARDQTRFYHGAVRSRIEKCAGGRRVLLFEQRPGKDRRLGATRSEWEGGERREGSWGFVVPQSKRLQRGDRIIARTPREKRSGYICGAARSEVLLHQSNAD